MSQERSELFCFGHRGARGYQPENTLLSIRHALELGAHGIEIDVHAVGGELVVIHDDTLDRTTNGHGRLTSHTLELLRSFDAGKGERIPILSEVIECIGNQATLNIELKGPGTAPLVMELITTLIRDQRRRTDQFLLSSFDHTQLEEVAARQPELRLGVLIDGLPAHALEMARHLRAFSIHPSLDSVTPRFVEAAHEQGLRVYVYTVNHPTDLERMARYGVNGVFSDFPDRVRTHNSRRPGSQQKRV